MRKFAEASPMLDDQAHEVGSSSSSAHALPVTKKRWRQLMLWAIPVVVVSIILGVIALEKIILRQNARTRAYLSDKTSMKGFEIAIKGYQTEYNRYPLADDQDDETPMSSEGGLLSTLMAEDIKSNPRDVRFFDPPQARKRKFGYLVNEQGVPQLVDSQGKVYRLIIDYDGDGVINDPRSAGNAQSETISAGIILWSGGMDGNLDTWKDNILSWQ